MASHSPVLSGTASPPRVIAFLVPRRYTFLSCFGPRGKGTCFGRRRTGPGPLPKWFPVFEQIPAHRMRRLDVIEVSDLVVFKTHNHPAQCVSDFGVRHC